ncbi:MAG: hypothetical protein ACQEP1_01430 [Nanobdellota archaeon]
MHYDNDGDDMGIRPDNSTKFLLAVIALYIVVAFFVPGKILASLKSSVNIFSRVLPALLVVAVLMYLFSEVKGVRKFLTRKGPLSWFFYSFAGILSAGPIYMWYPLLAELKEEGVKTSKLVVFMYNRAIKLPLLPVMISYFGLRYVLLLMLLMFVFSFINGKMYEVVS